MSGRGFTSEVSSAIGMNIEIEIDGEKNGILLLLR
jgi:hypothetical protein